MPADWVAQARCANAGATLPNTTIRLLGTIAAAELRQRCGNLKFEEAPDCGLRSVPAAALNVDVLG